jgi:hypothetical protein
LRIISASAKADNFSPDMAKDIKDLWADEAIRNVFNSLKVNSQEQIDWHIDDSAQ